MVLLIHRRDDGSPKVNLLLPGAAEDPHSFFLFSLVFEPVLALRVVFGVSQERQF
jgi:hypothetical protein